MIKLNGWQKLWCYMGFPAKVETIDELIYNYPSPYLLDTYAKAFFKYTPDGGPQDEMYPINQAWQRFKDGTGNDCEEFSRVFYEVLKNKYNCFMAWLFPRAGSGHAVVIYEENGSWKHLSNWGMSRGSWKELKDLYHDIYPDVSVVYMIQMKQGEKYDKIKIYSPSSV